MQHRGEILKKAIYKSGFPITELAKRLSRSRKWIYLQFDNSNVSLDIILEVGKIIHYDFNEEIRELSSFQKATKQSITEYQFNESEVEYWKNKYLSLLEEYNQLLKKGNINYK